MVANALFPIGYVSRVTGLSAHVIRVWQRRYGLVDPQRSATNRRLYSQRDIELLSLAKKAVDTGLSISSAAHRGIAGLKSLVESGPPALTSSLHPGAVGQPSDPALYFDEALAAVLALDRAGLGRCLRQAAVALPKTLVLTEVVGHLLERIGSLWAEGRLRIINEHMATTVIRSFLWDLLHQCLPGPGTSAMVVATPSGQWCELGALMAAVIGADRGWDVHYFGPNLPGQEIAAAAIQTKARAVALSVAFAAEPSWLIRELDPLAKVLPAEVAVFIGGSGIEAHRDRLAAIGFKCPPDLWAFSTMVAHPCPDLRSSPPAVAAPA